MKRTSYNTTPTRQGHKKLSLKAKRPKDEFNYSQQQQHQNLSDNSSQSTSLRTSMHTANSQADDDNSEIQFPNDDSNMNFDVVWDDRPTTPIKKNRPFIQIENLLKGFPFPNVESPVTRKQIMSLTGMDKGIRQSTPLTSKKKKNTPNLTDCLSYLRDLTTMLENPNLNRQTIESPTNHTSHSIGTNEQPQREMTPTTDTNVIQLEDSILNHSSLLQQLLSDSFDDDDDETQSSLYNQLTDKVQSPSHSSTASSSVTVSPSMLTTSPLIVSSNRTHSSSCIPKLSSNYSSNPIPKLQPPGTHVSIPVSKLSSSNTFSKHASQLGHPETYSSSSIPKPQPLETTGTHNSIPVLKRPPPNPPSNFISNSRSPETCLSGPIPKLQTLGTHSSCFVPKSDQNYITTHNEPVNHSNSSHSVTPKLNDINKSPNKEYSKLPNIVINKSPNMEINKPPLMIPSSSCSHHTVNHFSSDEEDDALFWSHVVSTIDTNGIENNDTTEQQEETDQFLDNLDKESLNKLFEFDEDDSPKQVCSQNDIERKKQQARRKLQKRHKTY